MDRKLKLSEKCPDCGKDMFPYSGGRFEDTKTRTVYEILWWCPDNDCRGIQLTEHYIKPKNVKRYRRFVIKYRVKPGQLNTSKSVKPL